jgi:CDP-glucose 4,6-dehydratase
MGKRALVTGATGFLGSHLCRALLGRGDDVTFLLRDIVTESPVWALSKEYGTHLRAVAGPLGLPDFIERVLVDYEVEIVYHLAAMTQVSTAAENPMEAFLTNTMGTLSVLEACRRRKVRRVVVASTDKTYGDGPTPYREDQALIERTPYGASKVCADVIAQTYQQAYGMSVAITRCGNIYGPGHLNFSTLIPGTIKRIYNNERPVVRFGGLATRDFLYVEDAVNAYLTLGDSRESGAFNFSGSEPRKIIDIVRDIIGIMGADVEPIMQGTPKGEIARQWLSCDRARDILGWSPKVSFAEGLKRTVDWYAAYFRGGKKGVA